MAFRRRWFGLFRLCWIHVLIRECLPQVALQVVDSTNLYGSSLESSETFQEEELGDRALDNDWNNEVTTNELQADTEFLNMDIIERRRQTQKTIINSEHYSHELEYVNGDAYTLPQTGVYEKTYPDGSHFVGNFIRGRRHGSGVFCGPPSVNQGCYDGSWSSDLRNGFGIYRSGSFTFEGNWANDQPFDENGKIYYGECAHYKGRVEEGQPHGLGTMVYFSNDKCKPLFEDINEVEGIMKKKMNNKEREQNDNEHIEKQDSLYVGMFERGVRSGVGVFISHQSWVYTGDWASDERHGYGKMISFQASDKHHKENQDREVMPPFESIGKDHHQLEVEYAKKVNWMKAMKSGIEYKGEWLNGHRHGRGILQDYSASIFYEGMFEFDQPHGQGNLFGDNYYLKLTSSSTSMFNQTIRSNGLKYKLLYEGGWKFGKRDGEGQGVWEEPHFGNLLIDRSNDKLFQLSNSLFKTRNIVKPNDNDVSEDENDIKYVFDADDVNENEIGKNNLLSSNIEIGRHWWYHGTWSANEPHGVGVVTLRKEIDIPSTSTSTSTTQGLQSLLLNISKCTGKFKNGYLHSEAVSCSSHRIKGKQWIIEHYQGAMFHGERDGFGVLTLFSIDTESFQNKAQETQKEQTSSYSDSSSSSMFPMIIQQTYSGHFKNSIFHGRGDFEIKEITLSQASQLSSDHNQLMFSFIFANNEVISKKLNIDDIISNIYHYYPFLLSFNNIQRINDQQTSQFIESGGSVVEHSSQIRFRFRGDFANGEYHGRGLERRGDGSAFNGNYMNGKRHGYCRFTNSNGDSEEGDYINDLKHGRHIFESKLTGNLHINNYLYGEVKDKSIATIL